ncbi:uncharacterized protein ARMOST_04479 [Armillaria ostoyae]|uniref:Uncharacterized protein n=1 Tax=Armillaria ostoyae TaxID=47428 RepID=A0A284QXF8_ARMOS|nr:uncharacterized protein ARMOST_04479 [Armillaria ostoyae]
MSLPVELIARILADTWASLTSTEEHIKTFATCSLVSREWFDIMKEVNSTHSWIPLAYNSGQLYTIKSLSSISNPILCRTLMFRVDYVAMPQRVVITRCEPSVEANKGIESLLRKLFYGPNPPRYATHIYVDYLDDSRVHTPSFWIPPQITRLTILYHFRSWTVDWLDKQDFHPCQCSRSTIDRQVDHLTIMGATPELTRGLITPLSEWKCLSFLTIDSDAPDIDIPSTSRISVLRRSEDFGYEVVEPDFLLRVMFGDQYSQGILYDSSYFDMYADPNIPMFEQVIPVGSVGYIDPMTRKFIILFNAIDPGFSMDTRLDFIPSLLDSGVTKLVIHPKHCQAWDREYFDSFVSPHILDVLLAIDQPASSTVGVLRPEQLYLSLGRACCKELVGTHFETWLLDHEQKILDIFGDEHPYIRKRLNLGEGLSLLQSLTSELRCPLK